MYLDQEHFEDGEDFETPEQKECGDQEGILAFMQITGCTVEEACMQLGLTERHNIGPMPIIPRNPPGYLTVKK